MGLLIESVPILAGCDRVPQHLLLSTCLMACLLLLLPLFFFAGLSRTCRWNTTCSTPCRKG